MRRSLLIPALALAKAAFADTSSSACSTDTVYLPGSTVTVSVGTAAGDLTSSAGASSTAVYGSETRPVTTSILTVSVIPVPSSTARNATLVTVTVTDTSSFSVTSTLPLSSSDQDGTTTTVSLTSTRAVTTTAVHLSGTAAGDVSSSSSSAAVYGSSSAHVSAVAYGVGAASTGTAVGEVSSSFSSLVTVPLSTAASSSVTSTPLYPVVNTTSSSTTCTESKLSSIGSGTAQGELTSSSVGSASSRPVYTAASLSGSAVLPLTSGAINSSTTMSSSASARPTLCGESGNFTLNWDDTPRFTPTNTGETRFPPVFNPYHHLFFSNGYAYVPPPEQPYKPVSAPHMAMFLPNLTTSDVGSPNAAGVLPGEIGAGPRSAIDAYWFDAFSAFLGCETSGRDVCTVQVSGFRWTGAASVQVVEQNVTLTPCAGLFGCQLEPVAFSGEFRGLSGIQFQAWVNGTVPSIFLLDDFAMGWANNTCEAGLLRIRSRK